MGQGLGLGLGPELGGGGGGGGGLGLGSGRLLGPTIETGSNGGLTSGASLPCAFFHGRAS